MLCNTKEMLQKALNEKYAVAQFNINNLEWSKYILEECQKNLSPVILGVSENAIKYMGGYNTVSYMIKGLIKDLNITIPVSLHLDHGSSFESCKKAIDAGFTSVMIDASKYEIDKNIEIVKQVCEYAKTKDVSVEAEVGSIGGIEEDLKKETHLAKVEDCIKLYNATKVDTIAPAIGSVHGLYKGTLNLNYKRIKEIKDKLNIPLVLHGGTGIPKEDLKKTIECGIAKININTELQVVWSKDVREYLKNNKKIYDPRKIISSAQTNMKKIISNKLHIIDSCNRI